MLNQADVFHTCKRPSNSTSITGAQNSDDANMAVKLKGALIVKTLNFDNLTLDKTLFSPHLHSNLLSLGRLVNLGFDVLLTSTRCSVRIQDTDQEILAGSRDPIDGFWYFVLELASTNAIPSNKVRVLSALMGTAEPIRGSGAVLDGESSDFAESSDSSHDEELINSKKKKKESSRKTASDHTYSRRIDLTQEMSDLEENDEVIPIMEHDYAFHSPKENENLSDEQILESLDLGANITVETLEQICQSKMPSIHKNLGWLFHIRLGHASLGYLKKLAKHVECLKNVKFPDEILDCSICKLAKIKRQKHVTIRFCFPKAWRLVHSDLIGPITPIGCFGFGRYAVSFIDDFSRFAIVFVIPDKTCIAAAFKEYMEICRAIFGNPKAKINFLRIDGGTEYMSQELHQLCLEENIWPEVTPPDCSQLNGVSEQFNLSILNISRSMLIDSGLPLEFSELSLLQATRIYNSLPHKTIGMEIPFELFNKRPVDIRHFRRFGSVAYRLKPYAKKATPKFASKTQKCIVLGTKSNAQHVLLLDKNILDSASDLEITESVTFGSELPKNYFELKGFPKPKFARNCPTKKYFLDDNLKCLDLDVNDSVLMSEPTSGTINLRANDLEPVDLSSIVEEQVTMFGNKNDSKIRKFRRAEKREFETFCNINNVPKTYKEAISGPEATSWKTAIQEELNAQYKNNTWTYANRKSVRKISDRVRIIDSWWVFTKKSLSDGNLKYKARLVIRGFQDNNLYDYSETYAPVAGLSEVRIILCLANKFDWDLHQMDVSTAFINSFLEKKVLMRIPEGVDLDEKFRKENICVVHRALYGLRTSPKRWWLRFRDVMVRMNFKVYENQACLFYWRRPKRQNEIEDQFVFVLLYVDNIICTGNCKTKILETRKRLNETFEMKNLGEPTKFLGLEILRDRKNSILRLTQTKLIDSIVKKFGLSNTRLSDTPFRTRQNAKKVLHQRKTLSNLNLRKKIPYREAVGALLYISNCTRPDISFAVNCLARRQANYNLDDWLNVERVIRYLNNTRTLGLV